MKKNEQKDKWTGTIVEDLRQKTDEYAAEGDFFVVAAVVDMLTCCHYSYNRSVCLFMYTASVMFVAPEKRPQYFRPRFFLRDYHQTVF